MNKIFLYGTIGEDWWDENAVSAGEFVKQLEAFNGEEVHVFVNSSGGSAFDGSAIYSAIMRYPGRVVAHIDGIAASAASFCILSADEVIISPSAMMMIHNAWTYTAGNASELRSVAESLEKLDETITGIYVRKTGIDSATIAAMMNAETWLTADECVEQGFADSMDESSPAIEANINKRMFAMFKNAPEFAIHQEPPASEGETETATCKGDATIINQTEAKDEASDSSTGTGYCVIAGRIYEQPKKGSTNA